MTRELFYGQRDSPGLARCLTVFGDGRININTAPKYVLRALAEEMTDDEVERLDKYRQDERNNLGDPGWYLKLPRAAGINIPAGLITVQSGIFRITAVGLKGRVAERITGVIKRESNRRAVKLLSWKVE
jgi:general secretion pathway protein K